MGGAEGPVGLALGGYRPPLRCTPFWEWLRSPTAFPASLHSLPGVQRSGGANEVGGDSRAARAAQLRLPHSPAHFFCFAGGLAPPAFRSFFLWGGGLSPPARRSFFLSPAGGGSPPPPTKSLPTGSGTKWGAAAPHTFF